MYEFVNETSYDLQPGKNNDSFTWIGYDRDLKLNNYNLYEYKFNLSDVTLEGTPDHLDPIKIAINRLQVRLDDTAVKRDAYFTCFNNSKVCPLYQNLSTSKI